MSRLNRHPQQRKRTHPSGEPDAPKLPDVLQFMQVLWAIFHGLQTRSKRMATDLGVTGPQRLVLRVVGLRAGLSAGMLATILHVHPSTLTGVLQRLVANGLLRRSVDAVDRRRAVLSLTAKGARVNALTQRTVEAAIVEALARVPRRERLITKRVLTQLAATLTDRPQS